MHYLSFYVGQTTDLKYRKDSHNNGKAAQYTSFRRPVKLVFQEEHQTLDSDVKRETQLKKWTHAKKKALIDGNIDMLKELSKSPLPVVN